MISDPFPGFFDLATRNSNNGKYGGIECVQECKVSSPQIVKRAPTVFLTHDLYQSYMALFCNSFMLDVFSITAFIFQVFPTSMKASYNLMHQKYFQIFSDVWR